MPTEKPRRTSAAQTRDRLLAAAVEQLDLHGAPARLDHVSLEELVKITGLPRSSAYSAWEKVSDGDTPQETFRRELMKSLIIADGIGVRDLGPLEDVLPEALSRIEGLPALERRRELIRLTAGAQFESSFVRPGYRLSLALTFATISVPAGEVDEEVLDWLRATEAAWLDVMVEVFQGMAILVGITPAPEFDPAIVWQMFTSAVLGLGEGLFGRTVTSNRDYLMDIPGPGPQGTTEMWTLYALSIDALVDRFFIFTDETPADDAVSDTDS